MVDLAIGTPISTLGVHVVLPAGGTQDSAVVAEVALPLVRNLEAGGTEGHVLPTHVMFAVVTLGANAALVCPAMYASFKALDAQLPEAVFAPPFCVAADMGLACDALVLPAGVTMRLLTVAARRIIVCDAVLAQFSVAIIARDQPVDASLAATYALVRAVLCHLAGAGVVGLDRGSGCPGRQLGLFCVRLLSFLLLAIFFDSGLLGQLVLLNTLRTDIVVPPNRSVLVPELSALVALHDLTEQLQSTAMNLPLGRGHLLGTVLAPDHDGATLRLVLLHLVLLDPLPAVGARRNPELAGVLVPHQRVVPFQHLSASLEPASYQQTIYTTSHDQREVKSYFSALSIWA